MNQIFFIQHETVPHIAHVSGNLHRLVEFQIKELKKQTRSIEYSLNRHSAPD